MYICSICIYLVLATPFQGFPILERQDGRSKLPLNAAAAAGRWNSQLGSAACCGFWKCDVPFGKQQETMENRHSKWVNQINTWLFSISWKWLRKSTPTIIFWGFPMFLTNVMHLKKLMYLKYVMQIYFPFEKHKLSISRIWPYGSGGFLLG